MTMMRTATGADGDLARLLQEQPTAALEIGDVVLTYPRAGGPVAWLNCAGQGLLRGSLRPSPFSHAALVTDPFHVIDATRGETLAMRPLADWLAKVDPAQSVVLRLPATVGERSRRLLRRRMLRFYGRPYNPRIVGWLPIRAPVRSFYCSEYVAAVYRRCLPPGPHRATHLPMDLPALLRSAGFTQLRLIDCEQAVVAPISASATLFDRLGPLAGATIDRLHEGTVAIAAVREASFTAVVQQIELAHMQALVGWPGTGAGAIALLVDHLRGRIAGLTDLAEGQVFEGAAVHAVPPARLARARERAVELALSEAAALGGMLQQLADIRDATRPFDPVAPDPAVFRPLQEALIAFWRGSGASAAAFISAPIEAGFAAVDQTIDRAGAADDDWTRTVLPVLAALASAAWILRFVFTPWGQLVHAAAEQRRWADGTIEAEARSLADLWLWIAQDRAPELDPTLAALAAATQKLAFAGQR